MNMHWPCLDVLLPFCFLHMIIQGLQGLIRYMCGIGVTQLDRPASLVSRLEMILSLAQGCQHTGGFVEALQLQLQSRKGTNLSGLRFGVYGFRV